MNDVEKAQRAARLVCLKMSDEMPAYSSLPHFGNLLFGFLHAILAEVSCAEFDESLYQTRGMGLADRDQRDSSGLRPQFSAAAATRALTSLYRAARPSNQPRV